MKDDDDDDDVGGNQHKPPSATRIIIISWSNYFFDTSRESAVFIHSWQKKFITKEFWRGFVISGYAYVAYSTS